jgi:hypothetical protein
VVIAESAVTPEMADAGFSVYKDIPSGDFCIARAFGEKVCPARHKPD